ncbi:GNAT family acetyltransferase [Ceratobasidium sp. AG-Ba]|nr:GNAT family acetyltransferase [Ceratobasidium sp. AG-Ba]
MPSLSGQPNISLTVYATASDFLFATHDILMQKEEQSNIILPFALNQQRREQQATRGQNVPPPANNLWICVWTTRMASRGSAPKPTLDFVFAINDNSFGGYPLFIWSNHPASELMPSFLDRRVQLAAMQLHQSIPAERVFSVFGLAPVVSSFRSIWSHITGKQAEPVPFYAAKFTLCTKFTLQPSIGVPAGDLIRPAAAQDVEQVARLCQEFAEDSVFFPLDSKESMAQAQQLIRDKQLWVYETRDAHNRPCVASIVASSRSSARVAAITKVYTPPAFRGRKYALRLVQWVAQQLLYCYGKESVVLYVSHENPAEKVYHRVGFTGLCGTPRPVVVEDWLEIGFKGTIRGHW